MLDLVIPFLRSRLGSAQPAPASGAQESVMEFVRKVVSIASITRDPGLQVRARMDQAVVVRYAQERREGVAFDPPIVFQGPEGRYWLADGWHRIASVEHDDGTEIEVEIRLGGRTEALRYAAGANSKHGLALSNADKNRIVDLLLDDPGCQDLSGGEIARIAGCVTPQFVNGKIRERRARLDPDTEIRARARRALERLRAEGLAELIGMGPVEYLIGTLGQRAGEQLAALDRALAEEGARERAQREALAERLGPLQGGGHQLVDTWGGPGRAIIRARIDLAHSVRRRFLPDLEAAIGAVERELAHAAAVEAEVARVAAEAAPAESVSAPVEPDESSDHELVSPPARAPTPPAEGPPAEPPRALPPVGAQLDIRQALPTSASTTIKQADGSFLVPWPIALVDDLWGPVREVQARGRKRLLTREDCAQVIRDMNHLMAVAKADGRSLALLAVRCDWAPKDAQSWGEERTAISVDVGPGGVLRLHVRRTSHNLGHLGYAQLTIPLRIRP